MPCQAAASPPAPLPSRASPVRMMPTVLAKPSNLAATRVSPKDLAETVAASNFGAPSWCARSRAYFALPLSCVAPDCQSTVSVDRAVLEPRSPAGLSLPRSMFRRSRPVASGPAHPGRRARGGSASSRGLPASPGGLGHQTFAVPFQRMPPSPQLWVRRARCRFSPTTPGAHDAPGGAPSAGAR
jgi:hypothetical protein